MIKNRSQEHWVDWCQIASFFTMILTADPTTSSLRHQKPLQLPLRIFITYSINRRTCQPLRPNAASNAGATPPPSASASSSSSSSPSPNPLVPAHAELLVYHRDALTGDLRCMCVFGHPDDVGCVFASTATAASCLKGYGVTNSAVFIDTV